MLTLSPDFIVTIHTTEQSDDPLYKAKLRMARRMKSSLKELRYHLTHLKTPLSTEEERFFRMRYFNIKALQEMLGHGIAQWKNCRDEDSILQQCAQHCILPRLDEWDTEWVEFYGFCRDTQKQRIECREKLDREYQKAEHLISIKETWIKALLGTLKLNPGFRTDVYDSVRVERRKHKCNLGMFGTYYVKLHIGDVPIHIPLPCDKIESSVPQLLEHLKQINALVPEFQEAFAAENQKHGPLYLSVGSNFIYRPGERDGAPIGAIPILYITDEKFSIEEADFSPVLASNKVLGRINEIFNTIFTTLTSPASYLQSMGSSLLW